MPTRAVDPFSESARRGVLAVQHVTFLAREGAITADGGLLDGQFQPNSIDLRLGRRAHRVRCSFLPGPLGVDRCLAAFDNDVHAFDLAHGAVLEPNVPYLIELAERLRLPRELSARANPKSSTGRLDMFARVVADTGEAFDEVPAGFEGRLFVHVISRSFPVRLRTGDRLVQLRIARGETRLDDAETLALHGQSPLIAGPEPPVVDDGLHFSAALAPEPGSSRAVGFRARAHTPLVDFSHVGAHPVEPFWSALPAREGGALVLEPEAFYVLASHERVCVPPPVCAEMVPFDAKSGELRTHYAGFFDSGFGAPGGGARVVLEIRNRDTPFLLRDRQRIFRFQLHHNLATPDVLYGEGAVGSNYQGQGLRLAKHFRQEG
jgi:dCTP deaminase